MCSEQSFCCFIFSLLKYFFMKFNRSNMHNKSVWLLLLAHQANNSRLDIGKYTILTRPVPLFLELLNLNFLIWMILSLCTNSIWMLLLIWLQGGRRRCRAWVIIIQWICYIVLKPNEKINQSVLLLGWIFILRVMAHSHSPTLLRLEWW